MQRSLLLFENSLKTEATRKMYLYFLDNFKNFYKLQIYDSIIAIGESELQIMVEDYVMLMRGYNKTPCVENVFYAVEC